MISEFLLLMIFLEKTWFTPVGKVLDDRDKLIRDKLGAVKVRAASWAHVGVCERWRNAAACHVSERTGLS